MSAEEEKVVTAPAAPVEPEQIDEKPKSDKKSKEKTPKSPKAPKKTADKKAEVETTTDAGHAADEKPAEKNGAENVEKAAAPTTATEATTSEPAAAPAAATTEEKVETTETPKKEKKEKKDKKEKKVEEAATAVVEEKKEKVADAAPAVTSRGRSNSKAALKTAQQLEEEGDNAESIRLWHQPGNVRSSRVLWLLKELEGTVVEHLKVSTQTSHKDKRDTIAAVNPTGEVPTLRFGNPGFSLFEPGAMFQYLLETHPGPLYPSTLTPEERARHAQYEHWFLGQVDPRVVDTGVTEKLTRTNTNWFRTTVEAFISADLGLNEYMNGENFSATDIIIGSTLWAADQHGLLSHVNTSAVHAYYERLRNRPHFIDVFGPPPEPKEPRSPRAKVEEEKKEKKEKKKEEKKEKKEEKDEKVEDAAAAASPAPSSPRGKDKKEKKDKKKDAKKENEEKKETEEEKKEEKKEDTPAAVLEAAITEGPAPVDVALTRPDPEPTPTEVQGPVPEAIAVAEEKAAATGSSPAAAAPTAADAAPVAAQPAPAAAPQPSPAAADKPASSESDSPISSSSSSA